MLPAMPPDLELRAARHAALGDPVRLAIVDALLVTDRSPVELGRQLDLPSNLLAHHLDTLEEVGLIERSRSSGDGRRRYVHLRHEHLPTRPSGASARARRAVFVCTANSARSQLAAAMWGAATGGEGTSAGTHPAEQVHPLARRAAERAGLDLGDAAPRLLDARDRRADLIVTVCDRAHEELDPPASWLHWSIPDPVPAGDQRAFTATVEELRQRIALLAGPGPGEGS